jgi:hypothetical protein
MYMWINDYDEITNNKKMRHCSNRPGVQTSHSMTHGRFQVIVVMQSSL